MVPRLAAPRPNQILPICEDLALPQSPLSPPLPACPHSLGKIHSFNSQATICFISTISRPASQMQALRFGTDHISLTSDQLREPVPLETQVQPAQVGVPLPWPASFCSATPGRTHLAFHQVCLHCFAVTDSRPLTPVAKSPKGSSSFWVSHTSSRVPHPPQYILQAKFFVDVCQAHAQGPSKRRVIGWLQNWNTQGRGALLTTGQLCP